MTDTTTAQVVSIGNAYETASPTETVLSELSELWRADEVHFSQKAAYWFTAHGPPTVVVARAEMEPVHPALAGRGYVCPPRITSSICSDLLGSTHSLECLRRALDRRRPVHLAPYVTTPQVGRLAAWLVGEGFRLIAWTDQQVALTARFLSKSRAHQMLFATTDDLSAIRPATRIVRDRSSLAAEIVDFAGQVNSNDLVLKSDLGVGGDGVFFLDRRSVLSGQDIDSMLTARGYNVPRVEAPFVLEERIRAVASPTVDVLVKGDGDIDLVGVCSQRLFDNRYYAGFHRPTRETIERVPWSRTIASASRRIGSLLASAGYLGPLNVDFVITADGSPYLIEINPRRSALVDALGAAAMISGVDDPCWEVSVADYVEIPAGLSSADVLAEFAAVSRQANVHLLPLLTGAFDTDYRWLGIAAMGPGNSEAALIEAITRLGCLADGTMASVVGAVEDWGVW